MRWVGVYLGVRGARAVRGRSIECGSSGAVEPNRTESNRIGPDVARRDARAFVGSFSKRNETERNRTESNHLVNPHALASIDSNTSNCCSKTLILSAVTSLAA